MAKGDFFKKVCSVTYALTDGGAAVNLYDNVGMSWAGSAESVMAQTDDDLWSHDLGSNSARMAVTLNNKDLTARGSAGLTPGSTIYDVVIALKGVGPGASAGAAVGDAEMRLSIDEANVEGVGGDADNLNSDVEGGAINLQAVKSIANDDDSVPYSWAVYDPTPA